MRPHLRTTLIVDSQGAYGIVRTQTIWVLISVLTVSTEALTALARPHVVLAGGTDFYPARVGRAIGEDVLDIGGIAILRGISADRAGWRLGATTTWSELIEADLPPLFDGLKQAAREVGGRQIQNAGTLAGNLCNASPAADGVPCLLALDAEIEIAGPRRQPPPAAPASSSPACAAPRWRPASWSSPSMCRGPATRRAVPS